MNISLGTLEQSVGKLLYIIKNILAEGNPRAPVALEIQKRLEFFLILLKRNRNPDQIDQQRIGDLYQLFNNQLSQLINQVSYSNFSQGPSKQIMDLGQLIADLSQCFLNLRDLSKNLNSDFNEDVFPFSKILRIRLNLIHENFEVYQENLAQTIPSTQEELKKVLRNQEALRFWEQSNSMQQSEIPWQKFRSEFGYYADKHYKIVLAPEAFDKIKVLLVKGDENNVRAENFDNFMETFWLVDEKRKQLENINYVQELSDLSLDYRRVKDLYGESINLVLSIVYIDENQKSYFSTNDIIEFDKLTYTRKCYDKKIYKGKCNGVTTFGREDVKSADKADRNFYIMFPQENKLVSRKQFQIISRKKTFNVKCFANKTPTFFILDSDKGYTLDSGMIIDFGLTTLTIVDVEPPITKSTEDRHYRLCTNQEIIGNVLLQDEGLVASSQAKLKIKILPNILDILNKTNKTVVKDIKTGKNLVNEIIRITCGVDSQNTFVYTVGNNPNCDLAIDDNACLSKQFEFRYQKHSGWHIKAVPTDNLFNRPTRIFAKNSTQYISQEPSYEQQLQEGMIFGVTGTYFKVHEINQM